MSFSTFFYVCYRQKISIVVFINIYTHSTYIYTHTHTKGSLRGFDRLDVCFTICVSIWWTINGSISLCWCHCIWILVLTCVKLSFRECTMCSIDRTTQTRLYVYIFSFPVFVAPSILILPLMFLCHFVCFLALFFCESTLFFPFSNF